MQILNDLNDLIVPLFVAFCTKDAYRYSKIISALFYIFEMGLARSCLSWERICAYLHVFGLLMNDDTEVIVLSAMVRFEVCEGVKIMQERLVGIIGDGIVFI